MGGPLGQRPYGADVAEFHAAMATLAHWMIAEGCDADEMLDMIEKPWRWANEATAARALRDAAIELDL